MRKLLLSSKGGFITDGQYKLFDKPRDQIRWAFIITASKSVPDITYINKHRQRMKEHKWQVEEIDLDGKSPDDLRELLKDKDAINMLGGNTFYLLKSIRASGFTEVLNEFLDRGGIFCGSSAGAYVACPTIEVATWKMPQKYNHHGITDFTALNLVPFLVVAHNTPEIEAMIKPKMDKTTYPVRLLTDQQAILVEGEKVTFLEDTNLLSNLLPKSFWDRG